MVTNKKSLTLLLVVVMLFASLAGCGNRSDAQYSAGSESTEMQSAVSNVENDVSVEAPDMQSSIAEAAASSSESEDFPKQPSVSYPIADGEVLTSWASMNANLASYMDGLSDNAVIQEAAKITGVTLKATSVSSDVVGEQFALMIAGGDYTDFIDNIASFYGSNEKAIEDGVIIDLVDYIPESAPDYYAQLSSNDDWLRYATTDSGCMPLFCTLTKDADAIISNGYLIRQDWLDELNLEMPTSNEELHDVLAAFKTEKNASAPLWFNSNGLGLLAEAYGVCAVYEPMGGLYPFFIKDGEVICGYQDDNFREYLSMANQWYCEGLIWKDFASDTFCFGINTSNALSLLLHGDMGVAYGEMKDINSLPAQSEESNMVLTAMPDPTKDGSPNHLSYVDPGIGFKYGISTACEDVELACQYINFFYTDEGFNLCTYGIEGQSFVYDDNGNPVYTELITNNPDGLSYDNAFEIYCLNDFPCLVDGLRKEKIYDEISLKASDVWSNSRDGAYFYPKGSTLNAEESETFNSIFTDINTYVTEMILAFITGSKDIDTEWDTFQATLKEMSIEDALNYKIAAYERYVNR